MFDIISKVITLIISSGMDHEEEGWDEDRRYNHIEVYETLTIIYFVYILTLFVVGSIEYAISRTCKAQKPQTDLSRCSGTIGGCCFGFTTVISIFFNLLFFMIFFISAFASEVTSARGLFFIGCVGCGVNAAAQVRVMYLEFCGS